MPIRSAAVVGAGLAGLACARALAEAGVAVRVFDKGRSPGGRLATRRVEAEGRRLGFDHGAQYLTARGDGFGAVLAAHAVQWPEVADREGAHVGAPGMSALPRALAAGLDVAASRSVIGLSRDNDGWHVAHHAGDLARAPAPESPPERAGPFDAIAVAVPHPQAVPLLPAELSARLASVRVAPCWALLAAFAERLAAPDTLRPASGAIAWAARDSAKPGRSAEAECWVVHAGPDWSRAHLERKPDEVASLLLAELGALTGPLPAVLHGAAHRWRYALVEAPLGAPCLADAAAGIGACGDWCLGSRAEHAWDSGTALAKALLGS
ncbi:NAD(P)/FAD-dependent oxidoreductase [Elioraea rosea]|uniref:NAD(P)/FAD-dependent oxidoreductase n=1 Tax=Elioraea rosea TaxID=2492390 RepID=UPI0019500A30|nr:FAD-dependent oxidoreductase [Elioraea rosea]